MSLKQGTETRNGVENECSRIVRTCSTPNDDCKELLQQMKPVFKAMEKRGAFLDLVFKAFLGDERLLLERMKPVLPSKWIQAPDQEMMLNYNWYCLDPADRTLEFKNNKIRLGSFQDGKNKPTRRQRNTDDKVRSINTKDLIVSSDGLSYVVDGAGCSCCNGNRKYTFTLLFHPQNIEHKLLVQEIATAFCCSSDNEEEAYEGYDYLAYMRKDDTMPTEIHVLNNNIWK